MTDWDKELARIDKQLASISDEELMKHANPSAPAGPARAGGAAAKPLPSPRMSGATGGPSAAGAGRAPWMAWAKVLVAVGAAAGLMYWPWPARCGALLVGFTVATGGVAVLGIWSAVGTWRHRLGWAHIASLLVIVWGLALGARETLPRVGYAVPSVDRPAQWSCNGLPAISPPEAAPEAAPGAVPGVAPGVAPGVVPGAGAAAAPQPAVTPAPGGTAL